MIKTLPKYHENDYFLRLNYNRKRQQEKFYFIALFVRNLYNITHRARY